ncbi:MAG TPA: cytochrome C [Rudaea sp.]|jgi:hypothetical protein
MQAENLPLSQKPPIALRFIRIVLAVLIAIVATQRAMALPSFAQQTGQPCATCHVGAFGPQLTPFGRSFKLGGYTLAAPDSHSIPLAAMLVASYTHTKSDQPDNAGPHDAPNDNFSVQEASLFLAGRVSDHIGVFAQTTYSDIDRLVTLDNVDVRYAQQLKIGEKPAILGVSVNNNPTVQDVWNTLSAWRFPYMASELVPEIASAPLIEGGLEHQVMGVSGYTFFDNSWYAELGGYRSLSHGVLDALNVEDSAGRISGVAPYWRVAYSQDTKGHSWSLGAFGMNANIHPDRAPGPTDRFDDAGLDGSLQLFNMGPHVFTLNGAYVHEHQGRDASFASGASANRSDTLNSTSLNASYYYDAHYGVTLGRFVIRGSNDPGLYAPEPASGSRTGAPNSTGTILQADWTPFGAADSWNAPWINLRLGLQYTIYDKFNGASANYDGFGRNAHDNNTLFMFAWFAL